MSDSSSQNGQGAPGAEGGRPRRDRWANRRNDGACIYVGNLNFVTGWQELKDKMREVGDVVLVELIVDGNKRPKKPKGSALVTFRTAEDAQKAIATMNDVELDSRKMLVRAYEAGTRPHTIQGNYTREMLLSVGIGRAAPAGAAAAAPEVPHHAPAKPQPQAQGAGGKKKQPAAAHAPPPQPVASKPLKKQFQQQQPPASAGAGGKPGKFQHPPQHQHTPPPPPPVQQGRGRGTFPGPTRGGAAADRVQLRPTDNGFTVRGAAQQAPPPPTWSQPHEPQQGGAGGVPVPRSQRRTKLFVSNLPFDCNWRALRDTFAQVGIVRRADIITDANGRSRGMGTIVFETFEEAKKAIDEFDGIEMAGRAMQVRFDRDE